MTRNQDVARLLYEIGQILEVQGVAFKPQAYQRAARNIEALGEDIEEVAKAGRLGELPGVGKAIAEKIQEFLATGKVQHLEDLRKELPRAVLDMMSISGIGPKTAARLHKELAIGSLQELEAAARGGKIRKLKGFGQRSEAEILSALERAKARGPKRTTYATALEVANDLLGLVRALSGVERAEYAGSLRRGKETVGDVDLLVVADPEAAKTVVERLTKWRDAASILEKGPTRASIVLVSGLQVDVRLVPAASFGAAWQYFTGSKEHNIRLRTLALKKGWTVNEYALSRKSDGKAIAGATEEEIYSKLGLEWIPPELREDNGEIERAAKKQLPHLITATDLRGDLHTHTTGSDGRDTLKEMVDAAARLGYDWYGVSDHSQGAGIVRGLDAQAFLRQRAAIERLQVKTKMRLFQGAEVNIRKDGTLDLDSDARKGLDYVIASIHGHFDLSRADQTRRLLQALDEGADILGHPTTRLLEQRDPIDADWARVWEHAKERGAALEINASPHRLDLSGAMVAAAASVGCGFTINSDAHTRSGLGVMHFGITQARRGGLEAGQVWSTLSPSQLEKRLGHARRA